MIAAQRSDSQSNALTRSTIIFVWSQWVGGEWCGKHGVNINMLFFAQGFVSQQISLIDLCAKPSRAHAKQGAFMCSSSNIAWLSHAFDRPRKRFGSPYNAFQSSDIPTLANLGIITNCERDRAAKRVIPEDGAFFSSCCCYFRVAAFSIRSEFNQSINQSNYDSANIPGEARLCGASSRHNKDSGMPDWTTEQCWWDQTGKKEWMNVNDRFNVWNHWQSQFWPTGPPFTSLSADAASTIKCFVRVTSWGYEPTMQRNAMHNVKSDTLEIRRTVMEVLEQPQWGQEAREFIEQLSGIYHTMIAVWDYVIGASDQVIALRNSC